MVHPIVSHRLGVEVKCSLNTPFSFHSLRHFVRTKIWWNSTLQSGQYLRSAMVVPNDVVGLG